MLEWTGDECRGDIRNPEFIKHVRREYPDTLIPDERDFDRSVDASTEIDDHAQYRSAQLRKLKRMYRDWKAAQN
jgi:uncharacterized protein YcbK (DUF882 family)